MDHDEIRDAPEAHARPGPADPRRTHPRLRLRLGSGHLPTRIGREALAAFAVDERPRPDGVPVAARRWRTTSSASPAGSSTPQRDSPESSRPAAPSRSSSPCSPPVTAGPRSRRPRMVLPTTAHAAFHKAAHWLGVEPVLVDVDPVTKRADPEAMAAAIDDRTVLVVASAPSYAHGVIDPVEPIAAAAAAAAGCGATSTPASADGCCPHLRASEPDQPPWTFAVDGVTSLSLDLHKYAYTPKGVSILLHASADLRRTHLFASARWPGYTMLNTTAQSTKSGGPVAAAWAVVHHIGADRYAVARPRRRATATLDLAAAVDGIPGLSVAATRTRRCSRSTTDDVVRRLHDQRRDARPGVVRPAADALPRPAGDAAPDLQRGDGGVVRPDRPDLADATAAARGVRAGPGPGRARRDGLGDRPGHPRRGDLHRPARRRGPRRRGWRRSCCPSGWRRSTRCSTRCHRSCARHCCSASSTGSLGPPRERGRLASSA